MFSTWITKTRTYFKAIQFIRKVLKSRENKLKFYIDRDHGIDKYWIDRVNHSLVVTILKSHEVPHVDILEYLNNKF